MKEQYKKLHWTQHSKSKMRQYGLSKNKLINLLYKPQRKEKGIVPGTMALMQIIARPKISPQTTVEQNADSRRNFLKYKKNKGEIWLMYQDIKNKNIRKIISAWRYPGISKPGEPIPIPEDIKLFIQNNDSE